VSFVLQLSRLKLWFQDILIKVVSTGEPDMLF